MKLLLAVTLVAVVAFGYAAEEKKKEEKEEVPTIYARLIPADVLRDFPGMCFASTKCATFPPNSSWDLAPFCGVSTCVQDENDPAVLRERVEDCGPLPLANPKCKLSERTNKTAPFPFCCPKFDCEDGAKLEYPEIPTVKPDGEIAATEKINESTTAKP